MKRVRLIRCVRLGAVPDTCAAPFQPCDTPGKQLTSGSKFGSSAVAFSGIGLQSWPLTPPIWWHDEHWEIHVSRPRLAASSVGTAAGFFWSAIHEAKSA